MAHLPDAKGLHDLQLLLSRPGSDVPAVELLDPAAGPELVAARRMGADPVLDDEAKARYRRHLARLDEEIDRAAARDDTGRCPGWTPSGCAARRAACRGGLAGRSRRLGDEAERARKTVTARIRDTLRKLEDRHPPWRATSAIPSPRATPAATSPAPALEAVTSTRPHARAILHFRSPIQVQLPPMSGQ
ncbi:hypothetical protein NKG94_28195 [Micromonospora sp. M12]